MSQSDGRILNQSQIASTMLSTSSLGGSEPNTPGSSFSTGTAFVSILSAIGFSKVIAYLALSFFFPWLSSFEHSGIFSPIAREPYTTYAIGSPTFGTLIYNNDSDIVLMAYESSSYWSADHIVDLSVTLLLWTIFVIIFIWTARNLDGYESKGLARVAGVGTILCCIIEFVYLTRIYQTYIYYEMKLEIGPFVSLIAVALWFLLPRITRGFDNLKIPILSTKTTDD